MSNFCNRSICNECRKYKHDCELRSDGRWLCMGCYYHLAFAAAKLKEPAICKECHGYILASTTACAPEATQAEEMQKHLHALKKEKDENLFNEQSTSKEFLCSKSHHVFPTFVGDPVPLEIWHGVLCKCGKACLEIHICECGNKHIREISLESRQPLFGTHVKEAIQAIKRLC